MSQAQRTATMRLKWRMNQINQAVLDVAEDMEYEAREIISECREQYGQKSADDNT